MSTLRCPICERRFESEKSKAMPFCSDRCRQVDLRRWLTESYGLPVERHEDPDEDPGLYPAPDEDE